MDPAWEAFTSPLVAAAAVFVVHFLNRGRFAVIEEQLAGLRRDHDGLRGEVKELRAEMNDRFAEARAERERGFGDAKTDWDSIRQDLARLRSDITRVALAVDPHHGEKAG